MQAGFGLLIMDVMPIFMIIALDIIITMCFSINCSIVICSPIVCVLSREKPLVKTMTWGSIFYLIIFRSKTETPKIPCCNLFTFTLFCTFIYLLYLSLSYLILASDREEIDNPFYRVGCKYLFVYAGAIIEDLCVPPTGLIPWFLTEGNTYIYFAASPFSLQGKNQRKLKK